MLMVWCLRQIFSKGVCVVVYVCIIFIDVFVCFGVFGLGLSRILLNWLVMVVLLDSWWLLLCYILVLMLSWLRYCIRLNMKLLQLLMIRICIVIGYCLILLVVVQQFKGFVGCVKCIWMGLVQLIICKLGWIFLWYLRLNWIMYCLQSVIRGVVVRVVCMVVVFLIVVIVQGGLQVCLLSSNVFLI